MPIAGNGSAHHSPEANFPTVGVAMEATALRQAKPEKHCDKLHTKPMTVIA